MGNRNLEVRAERAGYWHYRYPVSDVTPQSYDAKAHRVD
jgi:hypothetical protein